MGQPICRKIADRHKDNITDRSVPGQDSVFTVTLPLNQSAESLGLLRSVASWVEYVKLRLKKI